MAYFPFFTDIKDMNCLIVGGNKHALEKVERLLPYEVNITLIDKSPMEEIEKFDIKILKENFDFSMLDTADFVVTCSEEIGLNKQIADECKRRRIPVNSVDDVENCTFIFPSLIKKGKLSVGISSSGASPYMTRYLKEKLLEIIPENTEEILDKLEELRPIIKAKYPDEKERKEAFKRAFLELAMSNEQLK